MGKGTNKKGKKVAVPKANIQELKASRDGGQIALRGYSYQFLYSCYLILSSSSPGISFQLEGIEDIDYIKQKNDRSDVTHIQLKYSVNKQDASFLPDVLKNFLETYLLDQNRFFKLVYDFPVAKGNLSKIFASDLDEKSRNYWTGVISNIKQNTPSWNWSVYDFDEFISHLSFEKIEKSILAAEIEKALIGTYEINTDNVSLFANSIKILCFEKMEQRAYVTKAELDSQIQSVKIDISKGPQNPAHSWIRKLDYSKPSLDEGRSFYEGKKATPADIASGFPIKRPSLEKDVINSICENTVTVIKASKDVVEVYYSAPYTEGGIEKSSVVLGAFGKTGMIEPGQNESVTLTFTAEDMASYDYTGVKAKGGAYVLEAGEYTISLRSDSHTVIDSRTLTIDKDRIYNDSNDGARSTDDVAATNQFDYASFGECTSYVSRADWEETFPKERAAASREAGAAALDAINNKSNGLVDTAEDIAVVNHDLKIEDMKGLAYDDPKWNDFLEQIPVSEMVNLVSNGGWATQEVPSVGKLGYTEVDGPNGINNIMAGSTGNQFCAQSVLACSWNTELAYDMGETFAQEAVAMKIAALYAPAMNIHRSPFSGRNYEYYSEDGLHSGKMAAAETQGIQSQGVTTYCKHFAVNDQESNRDSGGLLTWVNEQAMREIYIKPFEIAVEEGGTRGIMSSFNRIGEICAAENADLLTTVLRNEWGFRGTVITDCILQLSYINIDRAIAAGNDLILSLMNMQAPSEAVTNSPAGHQVLRTATHNILYTSANSIGQEVSAIPVPYWLYITVAVVDAGLIALCVFYFVRRRKNVKRWKEQNSVQA